MKDIALQVLSLLLTSIGITMIAVSILAWEPSPQPAPTQVQMPCFAPDVLGTRGFFGCPDGYRYNFKDI